MFGCWFASFRWCIEPFLGAEERLRASQMMREDSLMRLDRLLDLQHQTRQDLQDLDLQVQKLQETWVIGKKPWELQVFFVLDFVSVVLLEYLYFMNYFATIATWFF